MAIALDEPASPRVQIRFLSIHDGPEEQAFQERDLGPQK